MSGVLVLAWQRGAVQVMHTHAALCFPGRDLPGQRVQCPGMEMQCWGQQGWGPGTML